MRVLVTAATKYGATGEIAQAIRLVASDQDHVGAVPSSIRCNASHTPPGTGTALIRCSARRATSSLNGISSPTVTTGIV
jgi:hypothetical protein